MTCLSIWLSMNLYNLFGILLQLKTMLRRKMAGIQGLSSFCLQLSFYVLLLLIIGELVNAAVPETYSPGISRSSFPKNFKFGAASSAYQVEGAAQEGGRGPSIWDTFCSIPGKIADGKNGDVADDQYHHYKEDVKLVKDMGMDFYRFSISWSRIFPRVSPRHGPVNEEGIAYYNNLINELLDNDIEPFITLFHWDLPQALENEYGGFLNQKVVEDFGLFVEECFKAFGDRVKYWVTINEPFTFSCLGYDLGICAPGRCSPTFGNCTAGNSATEPYIVAHNMLLSHSKAVKIYKTKYQVEQKGLIGIALVANWMVPFYKSLLGEKANQRAIDFRIGWFMEPLTSGKYPNSMIMLVGARLPHFTSQQAKELKGSFDFLGYNYYTTKFTVSNLHPPTPHTDYILDAQVNLTYEVNKIFIGSDEGVSEFRSYPPGLREVLIYTKHRYNNPPIYITETGYANFDNGTTPLEQALNDTLRVKYHSNHLSELLLAISEGCDVRGYIVWGLLDDFEWFSGYNYRFGLHYVDYKNNLKRYPRASAHWFKDILTPKEFSAQSVWEGEQRHHPL